MRRHAPSTTVDRGSRVPYRAAVVVARQVSTSKSAPRNRCPVAYGLRPGTSDGRILVTDWSRKIQHEAGSGTIRQHRHSSNVLADQAGSGSGNTGRHRPTWA